MPDDRGRTFLTERGTQQRKKKKKKLPHGRQANAAPEERNRSFSSVRLPVVSPAFPIGQRVSPLILLESIDSSSLLRHCLLAGNLNRSCLHFGLFRPVGDIFDIYFIIRGFRGNSSRARNSRIWLVLWIEYRNSINFDSVN